MWLHRRSEEPAPTEVECYWRKSKLAGVGTKLKFITVKDFGAVPPITRQQSFLDQFIEKSKEANTSAQLLKYYSEDGMEKLGLHTIICDFSSADKSCEVFLKFAAERMSTEACVEIFHATEGQSECSLWRDMRYGRITASKLYETARCKTASGVLVESVIGTLKIRETAAMKRGKTLEKQVLSALEGQLDVKFASAGIMLSATYPAIGATPDAVGEDVVVEIKCPSTLKTFTNYVNAKNEIANKYMAQIQLQMLMLNKSRGIFCVADPDFEKNGKITIINVTADREFIIPLIDSAMNFWTKYVYPLLIKD